MAKDNGNKVVIGRIVHYAAATHSPDRGEGCCNASLVVKVHDQEGVDGKCNLAAFDQHGEYTAEQAIIRDAAGKIGTWHWPQECPDVVPA